MARKRVVTRTITTTEATLLCLDIVAAEPCNRTVKLNKKCADEKAILEASEGAFAGENIRPVHVVSSKEVTIKYGMPEEEFIAAAQIMTKNEKE